MSSFQKSGLLIIYDFTQYRFQSSFTENKQENNRINNANFNKCDANSN